MDASGGGEGLAEPIEDVELEVSTPAVPILTNGVSELKMNGCKLVVEDESPVSEKETSEPEAKMNGVGSVEDESPVCCERQVSDRADT